MSRPTLSTLLLSYQRPKTAIIVPVSPCDSRLGQRPFSFSRFLSMEPQRALSPSHVHTDPSHPLTSWEPITKPPAAARRSPKSRGLVANKSLRGSPRCPTREVHAVFGTSLWRSTLPSRSPNASSSCAPLPLRRRRSFFPDATPTGQRRTTPRLNLPAYLHL